MEFSQTLKHQGSFFSGFKMIFNPTKSQSFVNENYLHISTCALPMGRVPVYTGNQHNVSAGFFHGSRFFKLVIFTLMTFSFFCSHVFGV